MNISNRKRAIIALIVLVLIVFAMICVKMSRQGVRQPASLNDGIYHWTGRGEDGKWSSAGNWDEDGIPGEDAAVVFGSDADTARASVIDSAFSGKIRSLRIENSASLIKQENNLSIAEGFYQDSGEYDVKGNFNVGGDFVQKGESIFSVGMGEVRVAGKFEVNSGFKTATDSMVLIKQHDQWKMFAQGDEGDSGYLAKLQDGGDKNNPKYYFYNVLNTLRSYISQKEGWQISYGGKTEKWRWQYLFEGVERDGAMVLQSGNAGISAGGKTVFINRGNGIEESYTNSYEGIEQVFKLGSRPNGSGKLVLKGRVSLQNLKVKENGESSFSLLDDAGQVAFDYSHLSVTDANDRKLSAKMSLTGEGGGSYTLRISIDDTAAQYPIVVDPLSSKADWTGELPGSNLYYGKSASGAGDLNGDGYEDLAVGVFNYSSKLSGAGALAVYYGGSDGFATTPDWIYECDTSYAHMGYSVSAAGDVNGDGYDDVIVGADYYTSGLMTNAGKIYVFYGSKTGLSNTPWVFTGEVDSGRLGVSVAGVGDVNGDGFDDVAAGAFFYNDTMPYQGKAYVFYGSKDGLPASPSWSAVGYQTWALYGRSIAGAGDVDKDGFDDVLVSAMQGGSAGQGLTYLLRGSKDGILPAPLATFTQNDYSWGYLGGSVSGAGDVNGDGNLDVILGGYGYNDKRGIAAVYYGPFSGSISSPDWKYVGSKMFEFLGYSVSAAGDINADGFGDIAIGAPEYTDAFDSEGRILVFYGASTFPATTPDWSLAGGEEKAYMGYTVAKLGNSEKSKTPGVIIGAYGYNLENGRALAYYNSAAAGTCDPANHKPTVTTKDYQNIQPDPCKGFLYVVNWSFNDSDPSPLGNKQAAYEVEVREINTVAPVLFSGKISSSVPYAMLFDSFLKGGNIEYGKSYEWRVRVYDDDPRPGCALASDWSDWTGDLKFGKSFKTPDNKYPQVKFKVEDSTGADCLSLGDLCSAKLPITFSDDGSSVFGAGNTMSYKWYLDGAATVASTKASFSVLFTPAEASKNHNVRLEVTDNAALACSKSADFDFRLSSIPRRWDEVVPFGNPSD